MLKFRFGVLTQWYNLFFLVQITCNKGWIARQAASWAGVYKWLPQEHGELVRMLRSALMSLSAALGTSPAVVSCSSSFIEQGLCDNGHYEQLCQSVNEIRCIRLLRAGKCDFIQVNNVTSFYFYWIFQLSKFYLVWTWFDLQRKRRKALGFSEQYNFLILLVQVTLMTYASIIPQTEIGPKLPVTCSLAL